MTPVYISDKSVIDVIPYVARWLLLRIDVGPFVLAYFVIFCCIWHLQPEVLQGGGKFIVLLALPTVLACHLLVFLGTQWSIRFYCLVTQWRVASIDLAEVKA